MGISRIIIGVGLDQLTKWIAQQTLTFYSRKIILPNLTFQLVHNTGAAYGIFQNKTLILVGLNIIIITALIFYRHTHKSSKWVLLGIDFILMGAFGNLIDRILRGYVIDFIDIQIFPVFNLADIMINIGVAMLIFDSFKKPKTN